MMLLFVIKASDCTRINLRRCIAVKGGMSLDPPKVENFVLVLPFYSLITHTDLPSTFPLVRALVPTT